MLTVSEVIDKGTKFEVHSAMICADGAALINKASIDKAIFIMPVEAVSSLIKSQLIDIVLNNKIIGLLIRKGYKIDLNTCSEYLYFAALVDSIIYEIELGELHIFNQSYVCIEYVYKEDYLKNYSKSAFIWGSFSHRNVNYNFEPYSKEVSAIEIIPNIVVPEVFDIYKGNRSIFQHFGYERFLSLYHLLEYRYNTVVLEKLNKLKNETNFAYEVNRIVKYGEMDRLFLLHDENYSLMDIGGLKHILDKSLRFKDIITQLFYGDQKGYKKFTQDIWEKIRKNSSFSGYFHQNNTNSHEMKYLLISTSSFLIYRIRCTIVHAKLGEFILPFDQEEFVAEIGESLAKELILKIYD